MPRLSFDWNVANRALSADIKLEQPVSEQWQISRAGRQYGPCTSSQLKKAAESGQLQATDLLWKEGLVEWVAASSVKGLFPSPLRPPVSPTPPLAQDELPTLEADDELPTLEADNRKRMASPESRQSPNLELRGNQGKTLTVDGATIRIVKKAWAFATQRAKSIPIRNITSVEVKKPGGTVGFIQFSIAGGAARNSSFTWTGGAFDAVMDENSIVFTDQSAYQIALKIKKYVETYQETSSSAGSPLSAADEIVKLKALMDQGIITPEEFAIKKRRFIES